MFPNMLFATFKFILDDEEKSDLVAVGLWTDISVRLLRLPNLEQVTTVKLGGGKLHAFLWWR